MKLPRKLQRAATRAHRDGADATEFVVKQHEAILAAAKGCMAEYRAIRVAVMRIVTSGPDINEKRAKR